MNDDIVAKSSITRPGVVLFQPRAMVGPVLALARDNIRVFHLKPDVVAIGGEG